MDVFTNLNLSKPHRLGIIMEILGFPGGSSVKNLPAVQETQAQSLVWDDPLEEGTATHSSILAGESHGQRILQQCIQFLQSPSLERHGKLKIFK